MMQPAQQQPVVQKAVVVQPPKVVQQPQPEMDIGVDLSNLSEEEKAKILSVMARAQDLDQDYERHKRWVTHYSLLLSPKPPSES